MWVLGTAAVACVIASAVASAPQSLRAGTSHLDPMARPGAGADPAASAAAGGNWTPGAEMAAARQGPGAALLRGGVVLVAGGRISATQSAATRTAVRFISSGSKPWRPAGQMFVPRFHLGLAALSDGTALAVGGLAADYGASLRSAELYQPKSGRWRQVTNMTYARWGCSLAALPRGAALVVGGVFDTGDRNQTLLASAEVWHRGVWKPASPPGTPRYFAQAVSLRQGDVLLVGGLTNLKAPGMITATAELYSPTKGRWKAAAAMASPRHSFGLATLSDGRVLAAGGVTQSGSQQPPSNSAELYDPVSNTWTPVPSMPDPRYAFALAPLSGGGALAVGGSGWNFTPFLASSARYSIGSEPVGDRYRCRDGECTRVVSGSQGLPLAACQAVCKPASLFACVASKCVISTAGVNASTCKAVCKP